MFFTWTCSLMQKIHNFIYISIFELYMLGVSETRDYKLSFGYGVWWVFCREESSKWTPESGSCILRIATLIHTFIHKQSALVRPRLWQKRLNIGGGKGGRWCPLRGSNGKTSRWASLCCAKDWKLLTSHLNLSSPWILPSQVFYASVAKSNQR